MHINLSGKNKGLVVTLLSLIVCAGISASSHAAEKKNDKGGSFKYVVPTNDTNNDKCPGAYESLALTFVNSTDPTEGSGGKGFGHALAYNIYYVVDDNRQYKGSNAYPETDQQTFPSESADVKHAEYATGNSNWSYYGPIAGTYVNSGNTVHTPIYGKPGGMNLWVTKYLSSLENEYSEFSDEHNVQVITAYNKIGNYMNRTNSGSNTLKMRIPIRSYKRLIIQVISTDVGFAQKNTSQVWANETTTVPGGSGGPVMFDFRATSEKSGSIGVVRAYKPFYGIPNQHEFNEERYPSLAKFPNESTLDLRAVDSIVITMKGRDSHLDSEERLPENYFAGSDITVNYLKDKITGKNINCN